LASNINIKISSFFVFLTAIAAPVGNAAFARPPPVLLEDDFFGLGFGDQQATLLRQWRSKALLRTGKGI